MTTKADSALEVIAAVARWRVEHGDLPPFAVLNTTLEDKLAADLRNVFAPIPELVIAELDRLGRIPTDPLARARVLQAFNDRLEELANTAADGAMEAVEAGYRETIADLRRQGLTISLDASTVPAAIGDRIRQAALEFSQGTLDRLVGDANAVLADIAEQGIGLGEAKVRLREAFDGMADYELERIARTEINSFQNQGTHETLRLVGVTYVQWITSDDAAVRASHAAQHGTVVRLGEKFPNGLKYPGDRTGSIEEWINCRCRQRGWIPPQNWAPVSTPFAA